MFSKRLIKPELLDHAAPEEARSNLADLVRINQHFGGHSVLRKMMARVARKDEEFTLLDIGAASGDNARVIQEMYPAARITSLDYNQTNIEAAPAPKILADAFELPFLPETFDYVLCCLFLHHFTDEQVISLICSLYKAARRALLVCDLERHVFPYCFLPATKPFFGWERLTLHDGPISVRASFRASELMNLMTMARIERAEVEVHRPAFRISVVAEKRSGGGFGPD